MLTYEEFIEELEASFSAERIEYDAKFAQDLWDRYRAGKITEKGKMRTDIDDIGEIQNIVKGYKYVKYGENRYDSDEDDILRNFTERLSDVKHMSYYDTFLEEGAGNDIQRALNKYGVPLDVLRGVRKTLDMNGEPQRVTLEDGRNATVKIFQQIERVEGESAVITGFKIVLEYENGDYKTIYSWGEYDEEEDDDGPIGGPIKGGIDKILEDIEKLERKGLEFSKFSAYSMSGKVNNGYQNSKTRGEVKVEDVKITYGKNGKVYVRDSKGRFVGVKK